MLGKHSATPEHLTFLRLHLFIYVFIYMCVCVRACHGVPLEAREQPTRAGSLFLLCEFRLSDLATSFTQGAILSVS